MRVLQDMIYYREITFQDPLSAENSSSMTYEQKSGLKFGLQQKTSRYILLSSGYVWALKWLSESTRTPVAPWGSNWWKARDTTVNPHLSAIRIMIRSRCSARETQTPLMCPTKCRNCVSIFYSTSFVFNTVGTSPAILQQAETRKQLGTSNQNSSDIESSYWSEPGQNW